MSLSLGLKLRNTIRKSWCNAVAIDVLILYGNQTNHVNWPVVWKSTLNGVEYSYGVAT